jgi:CDP-glycerol glycerophosphotransferase (TagB/SpsB family)
MGLELVERMAAEGLQVIVKLHDRSYDGRERGSGGVDWAEQLTRYEGHRLVRIARESNGCPFMTVADAMISDHSSIAFEYMLLDRPLVVVDCPALIEHAAISPEKVQRLRAAADVGATPTEVTGAAVAALQDPLRLSAERRRTAADLFYQPGTATERALALIYRLVGLPARTAELRESGGPLARAG